MAKITGMPRLSPTMEEATLVRWAKQEGDDIAVDDLIAEIETDKATMEWRAFDAGVLLKILAPEGASLKPDEPVAIIGQRGDDIQQLLQGVGAAGSAPTPAQSGANQDPPEQTERAPSAPAPRDAKPDAGAQPAASETEVDDDAKSAPSEKAERVAASPSVRRIARERSLDLSAIKGSGPNGRIIQRDLDDKTSAHTAEGHADQSKLRTAASSERPAAKIIPLSATRRTIARRLTEAKQAIPHYYLNIEIDAEPLVAARHELNRALEKAEEKVSLNDLLIRGCAHVLRHFPSVNVSFKGDAIWHHQVVDIAIAVAIEEGLVTPVIRDTDSKGVRAIAHEVRALAQQAREKKLSPEQMNGGTFCISNLGMYGIDSFAAVINPPQAAILAVGAVREVPVMKQGAVVPGHRMQLTLSCDHRAIDGAVGAEWLGTLRTALENPLRLLL